MKSRRDGLIAFALGVLLFLVAAPQFVRDAAQVFSLEELIKYDRGFLFTVTEELLSGKKLYSEVYTPYGVIPVFAYLGFAQLFGNGPGPFYFYTLFLSSVSIGLSFVFLRRFFSRRTASLLTLLVFFRCFLRHVNKIGYINWETLILFAILLLWKEVPERNPRRSFFIGLLLACLQLSRFGGHVAFGGALLLVDVLWSLQAGYNMERAKELVRTYGYMVGGYLALILPFAAILLSSMRAEIANDVLWPSYMLEHYRHLYGDERYPGWHSLNFFLGTNLPILAGLVTLALAVGFNLGRRKGRSTAVMEQAPYELCLLPLFYLLSSGIYFRHAFHFWQYELFGIYGVTLAFYFRSGLLRAALLLAWGPAALLTLKIVSGPLLQGAGPRPDVVPIETPAGITLYGTAQQQADYRLLWASLEAKSGPRDAVNGGRPEIVVLAPGPGTYFFGRYRVASRHAWFLDDWVRPYENDKVLALLASARAAALPEKGTAINPLTHELADLLRDKLVDTVRVPDIGVVGKLQQQQAGPPGGK